MAKLLRLLLSAVSPKRGPKCGVCLQITKSPVKYICTEVHSPFTRHRSSEYFMKILYEVSNPGLKNVALMGRKTWDELPATAKPLPNMINIILSRKLSDVPEGVIVTPSFPEALEAVNKELAAKVDKVIVLGGTDVYKEAIESEQCEKIHVFQLMKDYSCDRFFPEIDETLYESIGETGEQDGIQEADGIQYVFRQYERRKQS